MILISFLSSKFRSEANTRSVIPSLLVEVEEVVVEVEVEVEHLA